MYICVCNGITERQIRACMAERESCSMDDLQRELGIATQCGRCEGYARQCLSILPDRSGEIARAA
jgi:bacterioferritin-associated ferredoxin